MSRVTRPAAPSRRLGTLLPPLLLTCLAAAPLLALQPRQDAPPAGAKAADAAAGPRFERLEDDGGVAFVLRNGATAEKRVIETMPGGLAAFDADGDGLVDLFFPNGVDPATGTKSGPAYWNRLYRNTGNLRFEDVTERAGLQGRGFGMGAAAADFDNDGDVDLFVPGLGIHTLYRNRGDGTFEDVTEAAGIAPPVWSVAAAWLDVDRDGRLDLFVVNYLDWAPDKERFCGDRARNLRVYCHPKHYDGLPNTLYRNRGDGTFEDISVKAGIAPHVGKGMSVAAGDFDGDGWPDLVVTNDTLPNFYFRNTGAGVFEEFGLLGGLALPGFGRPVSSMGVDARDVTNDGRPDVLVTALSGETFPFFTNDGGGLFRDATHQAGLATLTTPRSGWGVAIADLDNDGWKDVATANSHVNDEVDKFEASRYREANAVFRNRDGRFEDVSAQVAPGFTDLVAAFRGLVAADLDNDGRLDLVTTRLGEGVVIWRNVSAPRRWLRVRLHGRDSNSDGIGAIVRAGTVTEVMTSAVGYASSRLAPVQLGLGDAARVSLEIVWPSGRTQRLADVETNQTIEITEPEA